MLLGHPSTLPALVAIVLASLSLLAACGSDGDADDPPAGAADRFDAGAAFADLERQVELGPRPAGSPASRRLTRILARSLREAGLGEVRIQRPHRNVLATIPGRGKGAVVVGAHHDTKDGIPGFVGANDGASGVAVVLELARSLPRPNPGPEIRIVLFDAEEARGSRSFADDGLRGSRQYVRYAEAGRGGAASLERIRAMVLFDLVGDCELAIPREELSDPGLYGLFAAAAAEVGQEAVFEGRSPAVLDDHVPFREAGVPALDLIDFSFGDGPPPGNLWHSAGDTLDVVCEGSLDAVGEAAVRAIPRIGGGER